LLIKPDNHKQLAEITLYYVCITNRKNATKQENELCTASDLSLPPFLVRGGRENIFSGAKNILRPTKKK
jgi:hypothetical protein